MSSYERLGSRGEAMPDETMQEALADAFREADESFIRRTQERLDLGDKKYGPLHFLEVDTLEEAIDEVLDLANYARFTYIKLYLLQQASKRIMEEEPLTDKQGFVSFKEMFGGSS
jgi:hypothetical protein